MADRRLAEGIERAEREAREYASIVEGEYLGLAHAYLLADHPDDGGEVFSLLRESDLPAEAYLNAHFHTGRERQR